MPTICTSISETHFPPVDVWLIEQKEPDGYYKPQARLSCGHGRRISSIRFASFGKPSGRCGHFHKGSCHALGSMHVLEKVSNLNLCFESVFLFVKQKGDLQTGLRWKGGMFCGGFSGDVWRRSLPRNSENRNS